MATAKKKRPQPMKDAWAGRRKPTQKDWDRLRLRASALYHGYRGRSPRRAGWMWNEYSDAVKRKSFRDAFTATEALALSFKRKGG